jgi:hypothetical protein
VCRSTRCISHMPSSAALSASSPSSHSSSKKSSTSAKQVLPCPLIPLPPPFNLNVPNSVLQALTAVSSGCDDRRHHLRSYRPQPVQSVYMGQHRPNHPRALPYRPHCPSFCRRGRVAKGVHVAALEEFVFLACAGHGLWLAR